MKLNFLKIIIIIAILFLLIFIAFLFTQKINLSKDQQNQTQNNIKPPVSDYKNLTYVIENKNITLVNGISKVEVAPGSALKITTRYFGNDAFGDLNDDKTEDVALLLTQETGGSGTFYYLAAALKDSTGYQPTNTIFLGDRIAPKTTQINSGIITVNYSDRKPGEPMNIAPSMGVSRYFKFENTSTGLGQDGLLVEEMYNSTFDKPTTFVVNQKIKFNDGLVVALTQINDSRCKPEVVCVWIGELSPNFTITGGNVANPNTEFILGTVTKKSTTVNGYTFTMQEATETTATIVVTKESKNLGDCYMGGCSNQICSDKKDIVSTCIYKEEYACYKTATCERQASGQCGWTQTSELIACLN